MILVYRVGYMIGEKNIGRFIILLILFVVSIILIILRPNLVRIIIGWDGLGLISFCLVIFYQRIRSYNSGIVTVLINRFGDIMILISIGIIIRYGRWNIFILQDEWVLMRFIIVASITKRAQIPFSSWLPVAIAAPTPISALVHSSTLVTAGVYLVIRYIDYFIYRGLNYHLLILSRLTIFLSGLAANFENDLKKIIALSTLRQIGLMMLILRIGNSLLAYYHLLTHAIFKSILFIRAGGIIHQMGGNQDVRFIGNLRLELPVRAVTFQVSIISLCGFPFISGFYSKDLIIEIVYGSRVNLFVVVLLWISIILTVGYSVRVIYIVFYGERKSLVSLGFERGIINISIILLLILSVVIGSLLR